MDLIETLTDATRRFAAELERADLSAPVPACSGWAVADLGEHLRAVHTWAAHAVTEGDPSGEPAPGPLDREGLVTGYREAAEHLVDVLARTPADAPVWAFGPKPRVAQFWRRRQAHETWVHLHDALSAAGREAEWDVPADVAWDGVAEIVEMFYPRQVRLGRSEPLPGTLRLVPTDVDAAPLALGAEEPVVELRDTAGRLLLMLWRRAEAPADAAALLDGASVTP